MHCVGGGMQLPSVHLSSKWVSTFVIMGLRSGFSASSYSLTSLQHSVDITETQQYRNTCNTIILAQKLNFLNPEI